MSKPSSEAFERARAAADAERARLASEPEEVREAAAKRAYSRTLAQGPAATMAPREINGEVNAVVHGSRKRVATLLEGMLQGELDAVEQMQDPNQRLQMLVILDMMLNTRPSVAMKGKEAFLRLKGLLVSKQDAEGAQRAAAQRRLESMM